MRKIFVAFILSKENLFNIYVFSHWRKFLDFNHQAEQTNILSIGNFQLIMPLQILTRVQLKKNEKWEYNIIFPDTTRPHTLKTNWFIATEQGNIKNIIGNNIKIWFPEILIAYVTDVKF